MSTYDTVENVCRELVQVVMAGTEAKANSTPRDVQVIQSILKDMGVTDYEPAVVSQLLDFTYSE